MAVASRLLIALALVLAVGCSDDDGDKDQGPDAPVADLGQCPQPPDITYCHKPPNAYSNDLWFCEGCSYCSGGPATKACNATIGDCREFYDTCIPATYTRCNQDAPDNVLGLCGDCFFREAGVIPPHCNKLVDAGLPLTDSSPAAVDLSLTVDAAAGE